MRMSWELAAVVLVFVVLVSYVVWDGRLFGGTPRWEIGDVRASRPTPAVALTYTEVWRSGRGTIRVSDAALRGLTPTGGFSGHLKDGVITLWDRTCDGASKSCDKSDMYIQVIQKRKPSAESPVAYLVTYSHTPDGSPRTYILKDTSTAHAPVAHQSPATGAKGIPLTGAEPTPLTSGDYVAWQPTAPLTPKPKPPAVALRRS